MFFECSVLDMRDVPSGDFLEGVLAEHASGEDPHLATSVRRRRLIV
jgi:hypothetical protein